MASVVDRPKADANISMRIPVRTRELIDIAAAAEGKSRSDFMIESARLHAIDVLLDQRVFALDAEQSDRLADVLAHPPTPTEALRKLMRAKMPWAE